MKFTVLGIMQCVHQETGNLRDHVRILLNTQRHTHPHLSDYTLRTPKPENRNDKPNKCLLAGILKIQ